MKRGFVVVLSFALSGLLLMSVYGGVLAANFRVDTPPDVIRTSPTVTSPVIQTTNSERIQVVRTDERTIATPSSDRVLLEPWVHEYQKMNNCGPAALAAALNFQGVVASQFELAKQLKGSASDKNVNPEELVAYTETQGLGALYRVGGTIGQMEQFVSQQIPVIVHHWLVHPQTGELVGHYRVVRGFDRARQIMIVSDSFTGAAFEISYEQFVGWWQPFNYGYIPIYKVDQVSVVQETLGQDWDSFSNFQRALNRAQGEIDGVPSGYAYYNFGVNALALGDLESAEPAFEQAFALDFPRHFLWYRFDHLELFLRLGQYDRVLTMTDELLSDVEEFEELRVLRAMIRQDEGDFVAARFELSKALEANPHYAQAQSLLMALGE